VSCVCARTDALAIGGIASVQSVRNHLWHVHCTSGIDERVTLESSDCVIALLSNSWANRFTQSRAVVIITSTVTLRQNSPLL
jgi:hypothetical protein